jgi:NhaP-type Na+/H+ or K+/H+ antiporter
VSTDDVLLGLGLVLVLAVGAQLASRRLAVPAIVVLLPAGFVAGIVTDDVQPDALLGQLYQPFVSIAVGVILFEAGLRLRFDEIAPDVRALVPRLIVLGGIVTWAGVAATCALLFGGMDRGVAILIGAILVVSGPTVVLPLLGFIRPSGQVRSLLSWEGVLIDPVGAIVGVLVFLGVESANSGEAPWRPGEMLVSVGTGALVGVAGALALYGLVRVAARNAPDMMIPTALMVVVATVVTADLLRDDSGLAAATVMGAALANQHVLEPRRRIDITVLLDFHETLVGLLIGVLFILVSASVSPSDVDAVLPEALALVAVMVLVIRPAAVGLATWRSSLSREERAFVAWMAPRGIVAGATASAFGPQLASEGVAGADHVLPIVFVAIFGTVVLYGLTAPPIARLLGVAGTGEPRVLVVSGHPWARDLAAALKSSGLAVRMWVGPAGDRAAARAAGLEAERGRMIVDAVGREAELEEITDALLLTRSDDFNALAAAQLRSRLGHGHVFRVAPDPEDPDLLPPSAEAGILGDAALTFAELDRRFAAGARFVTRDGDGRPASAGGGPADVPLFALSADGRLTVATDGLPLDARAGARLIVLSG